MKKLLVTLTCAASLMACGGSAEPQVIYVDKETGEKIVQKKPITQRKPYTVCVNGVMYYEDNSFRQGALAPVLVPSTRVTVSAENQLKSVMTKDRNGSYHTIDLTDKNEYVSLVGVTC